MIPFAAILISLLAGGGWVTDAQTDQRSVDRVRDAARAGRADEALAGARGLPPALLDAVAHSAACGGHPKLLEALLDQGARAEAFGGDAIYCLLKSHHPREEGPTVGRPFPDEPAKADVIRLLATKGAPLNGLYEVGTYSEKTILMAALQYCRPALVVSLLEGRLNLEAPPAGRLGSRTPPLILAAACAEDLVTMLVARGARTEATDRDGLMAVDHIGRVALDEATLAARLAVLGQGGAARHVADGTALRVAVAAGNLAAVKLLLAAGASPVGADAKGDTPLHAAASSCASPACAEIAQRLLAAGAPRDGANRAGETPYQLAVAKGTAPFLGHLLSSWPWKPLGASRATASAEEVLVEPKLPADFYAPARVLDGDPDTCWCARGTPPPAAPIDPTAARDIGESEYFESLPRKSIKVTLPRPARVRALRLWPGCTGKPGIYRANNRAAIVEIRAGEAYAARHLPDEQRFQDLGFTSAAPVGSIELTIRSVFEGAKFPDTCLGEIQAVLE